MTASAPPSPVSSASDSPDHSASLADLRVRIDSLDQRLIELAGRAQPATALKMIGGGAHLRTLKTEAGIRVVGMLTQRVGVLDDGAVVVLKMLSGFTAPERA